MKYVKRTFPDNDKRAITYVPHVVLFDEDEKTLFIERYGELKDDVKKWCIDHFGHPFLFIDEHAWGWTTRNEMGMYFKNKDDAMLFKLVWG